MWSNTTKILKAVLLCSAALLFLYFFYRCPIDAVFGIPCPGCNIRAALDALLKGDLKLSLWLHALLLPTMLVFLLLPFLKKRNRERLLVFWSVSMIAYWLFRLLYFQGKAPMQLNENAPVFLLFSCLFP